MKKNVIIFGLIAGAIITGHMLYMVDLCYRNPEFKGNAVIGYAAMLIVFSLIFVAIKNYRDKYNNGVVSFGKAFMIGLYISLITTAMYTIGWTIDYHWFVPDFMDQYTLHVLNAAKADGASPQEITEKVAEMAKYKELYKNPAFFVFATAMEIFPVGIVVSLISALILKRKNKKQPA